MKPDAVNRLATVFPARRLYRVCLRNEAHAGQLQRIHRIRERLRVDIGSADQLEWRLTAASLGDVRPLEEHGAGVVDDSLELRKVRRRSGPRKICLVEPQVTLPPRELNDVQVGADLPEVVVHPGELTRSHAVT